MIYTAALQLHIQVRNREASSSIIPSDLHSGALFEAVRNLKRRCQKYYSHAVELSQCFFSFLPLLSQSFFLGYISDCHDIYTFVCVARKRTTDNIPFIISLTRRGASLTVKCFVYKNFRMNIPTHTIWIPISWLEDETKLWNRVTKQKRKEKMSLIEHWNSLPPSPLRLVSQTCSLPISARRLFLGGEDWPL